MQHDDGASGRGLEPSQHSGKVDAAAGGVVVGVSFDPEAGLGKKRAVVFPTRVADHHGSMGAEHAQKVSADLQAAGAAERLDGRHPAGCHGFRAGAKNQALDGAVISSDAVDRQVAARLESVHHGFFGSLHAGEQRQLAVVVEIHAHAQIDLDRAGVAGELVVQAQDRVARGHFDGGKEGHGGRFQRKRGDMAGQGGWSSCQANAGQLR